MRDNKTPDMEDLLNSLLKGTTGRSGQNGKNAPKKPAEVSDEIVLTTTPDVPYATGAPTPQRPTTLDTQTLLQMNDDIMREINQLNAQLREDALVPPQSIAVDNTPPAPAKPADINEAFNNVHAALKEHIIGQDEFLRSLVIAFKRPFVMGTDAGRAKNNIVVRGPQGTGKHTAISIITDNMYENGLLSASGIDYIDLSLYAAAEDRKLFLQDLYRALETPEVVILFDNYSACHPSLLSMLSGLVQNGKVPLTSRYVLQKGVLVEAGNALTPNTVSELVLNGQYLVFVTENKTSKLVEAFGTPFIDAVGDTCETSSFTPESLLQIAEVQLAAFCERAKNNLAFTIEPAPECAPFIATQYDAEVGVGSIIKFLNRCFLALAEHKLQNLAGELTIPLSVEGEVLFADFGDGVVSLTGLLPGGYTGQLDQVKAEMDKVVGLNEIKNYILSLEQNFKVQQMRKEQGLQTSSPSMHMIFTGNPGTGKTTIARLTSKYLKAIGVLSGGQLIEVSRADLVGRYVGHTAPLTNQVIKSALGGVLFIDEAYSLYRGKDDSFGLEAIDALVKGMEDNRNNLVVILAGYSNEMVEFLKSNSGLKSRFPNIIEFPDYTGEELYAIAKINAEGQGYRLDSKCERPLLQFFTKVQRTGAREAGNGRLARNKVEEAILNQSRRILAEGAGELDLLLAKDFEL